jgi:hypothetical protein
VVDYPRITIIKEEEEDNWQISGYSAVLEIEIGSREERVGLTVVNFDKETVKQTYTGLQIGPVIQAD